MDQKWELKWQTKPFKIRWCLDSYKSYLQNGIKSHSSNKTENNLLFLSSTKQLAEQKYKMQNNWRNASRQKLLSLSISWVCNAKVSYCQEFVEWSGAYVIHSLVSGCEFWVKSCPHTHAIFGLFLVFFFLWGNEKKMVTMKYLEKQIKPNERQRSVSPNEIASQLQLNRELYTSEPNTPFRWMHRNIESVSAEWTVEKKIGLRGVFTISLKVQHDILVDFSDSKPKKMCLFIGAEQSKMKNGLFLPCYGLITILITVDIVVVTATF